MYRIYPWSENVTIFDSSLRIVETKEACIYGLGFDDFYCKTSQLEDIQIKNPDKINILVTHGSLDGDSDEYRQYRPMSRKELKKLGFDYIALGHIHKLDYQSEEGQNIVYPGSTVALGFDELGKHGAIVGNVDKESVKLEFIAFDDREFIETNLEVTGIESKEELIEKINEISLDENNFYKIILVGKRNFEINPYSLYPFIQNPNIIKIKDETKMNIDIQKISEEVNLKGLFVKEILEDVKIGKIDSKISEKILELGLEVLESK